MWDEEFLIQQRVEPDTVGVLARNQKIGTSHRMRDDIPA